MPFQHDRPSSTWIQLPICQMQLSIPPDSFKFSQCSIVDTEYLNSQWPEHNRLLPTTSIARVLEWSGFGQWLTASLISAPTSNSGPTEKAITLPKLIPSDAPLPLILPRLPCNSLHPMRTYPKPSLVYCKAFPPGLSLPNISDGCWLPCYSKLWRNRLRLFSFG